MQDRCRCAGDWGGERGPAHIIAAGWADGPLAAQRGIGGPGLARGGSGAVRVTCGRNLTTVRARPPRNGDLRTSPGKRRVGVASYRATSSRTRTCQTRGAVSVEQLKDMVALLDDPTSPLEGEPITMTITTAFEQIPLTMLRDP